MPVYLYRCPEHGYFEQVGGLDESLTYCACGEPSRRAPYSGIPYIKGETVAKEIPEGEYRREARDRAHRATGWDLDRAVRTLRGAVSEDKEGRKQVDLREISHE